MIIGTVTGSIWATRKAPCLQGQTFLVVDTLRGYVVAADHVGAGTGDKVLLVTGTLSPVPAQGTRCCWSPAHRRRNSPWKRRWMRPSWQLLIRKSK